MRTTVINGSRLHGQIGVKPETVYPFMNVVVNGLCMQVFNKDNAAIWATILVVHTIQVHDERINAFPLPLVTRRTP